jgi:trans-2,3-dihydro-3-hydroxyanthranilate isomerase
MIQVDVFTRRALEGNMLAVFPDGRGLSDAEMQALARETNLSETTFILPRDAEVEAREGVRVRIFTIYEELPFAGHPTLGTATVLRALRGGNAAEIALALNVGRIPVAFTTRDEMPFGEMRQRDPEFGVTHDRDAVARVCGLELSDFDDLPIQTVSTGVPFTMVPLRRRSTMRDFKFSFAQAADYLSRSDAKFFYFVTRDVAGYQGATARAEATAANVRLHARMIFYNGEDPATGSAAGCCAAWMVRHDVAKGDEQVVIAQGLEMQRPSFLYVRARRTGEAVSDVRVGGHCVEVMRGEVSI